MVSTILNQTYANYLKLCLIKKNSTVLNIGANIGLTALLFSYIADTVHTFEPAPSTFSYLKANIDSAKKKNIELHNIGFGDVAQNATIKQSDSFPAGAFISDYVQAGSKLGFKDEASCDSRNDPLVPECISKKISA